MSHSSSTPPDAPSKRRTSQAILQAAARVLADAPDASLDDVAQAADIGRATLYRHFPSRQALLTALHDEAVEEVGRRLADAALDRVPVDQALERIVRAVLVIGDRYAVVMREKVERLESARVEELVRMPIRAVLERGVREGVFRDDIPVETLHALFGSLLTGGVRLVSEQPSSLEDATAHVTAVALAGLRG
jgi:TetR/AcrR family transcriptional repressor of mexCD-oprJ operon